MPLYRRYPTERPFAFQILICRGLHGGVCAEVFARLFQKAALIQRAERWSPPQRRNSFLRHFFFAKLFSLGLRCQRKKRVIDVKSACVLRGTHFAKAKPPSLSTRAKGNPPLVWFPSAEPRLGIHPSVALSNDKVFRALRGATAELGGSAKPLKRLERNF